MGFGKFGAFVAGGAVGAALALMVAPRTGEEARALAADKANECWGVMQQRGADLQQRGAQLAGDVSARGAAAYETASSSVRDACANVTGRVAGEDAAGDASAADKNDELRQKIEAARQRIAAQVAKNAEETQAMGEKIQAAAEDAAVQAEATVADVAEQAAEAATAKVEEAAHAAQDATEE